MTRDEARQLLPIIQAYSEGKTVQMQQVDSGRWVDWPESICPGGLSFTSKPDRYRIKPEPIECWAVLFSDGSLFACDNRKDAELRSYGQSRVIRMREV